MSWVESCGCSGPARIIAVLAGTIAFVFLAVLATASPVEAKLRGAVKARPNIVVIQSDDAIRSDLRFMPHLRSLMKRGGAQYANYVAPYPLCGPARASFLTGQLAHNNKVVSNFEANDGGHYRFRSLPGKLNQRNSLGPWLHRAGYRTAMVGKYLNEYGALNRTEIPPGWDRWAALLDDSTYDYFNYKMNVNGRVKTYGDPTYAETQVNFARLSKTNTPTSFAELLALVRRAFDPFDYFGTQDESVYTMDVSGDYAVRFIRNRAHSKRPFFLYYAPPGPHAEDTNHFQGIRPGGPGPDPRPPRRYRHKFDRTQVPKTASFNEADVSDKASNLRNRPLLSDDQIDEVEDNYRGRLGAVRSVDDQIGRIARELRRSGEMKKTFIIFNSDNGYLQGEHRLRGSKYLPYENVARVPLLMRGPGVRAGRRLTGPTMDVDVTRTVLDMANVRSGRVMDGISLLPSARGRKRLPRRKISLQADRPLFKFYTPLTAFDQPYYGVRGGRYKYVHWSFDETELYDLKKDPDELVNLAADPARAGTAERLEKAALRLSKCRGSNCR